MCAQHSGLAVSKSEVDAQPISPSLLDLTTSTKVRWCSFLLVFYVCVLSGVFVSANEEARELHRT